MADEDRGTPEEQSSLPPAARMGLLNYLTATSLDEDYAHVSRNRAARAASEGAEGSDGSGDGDASDRVRRPGRAALVVLAAFGVLVATAAVQTSRGAEAAQEGHDQLVAQVMARQEQLENRRERLADLTREVRTLDTRSVELSVAGRGLEARLSALAVRTGAVPVRGPGVRVTVDDGPDGSDNSEVLDTDLQRLVNGLWLAGAEAIAINGERLTALSAIRIAGSSITVNYNNVSPPFVVEAIGDPDTLAARFIDTPGGQWFLDLEALYGVVLEIETATNEEPLTLPAATRLTLRTASTAELPETPGGLR
jgi:uncharacterized protein YlxW (UPF0749 family)